ncbi:uncharacterized protein EV422DRAFT_621882 [Fimicolochytrium jonesii]|uniref:uncharacterized protein n=1 Tax=Fimicolochytrium jonesii TaxID=1396493 RepID=UPI0022FED62F|nr:uncharacterized protein EV422DRAFT_621882 [Fimicolochytrium jonesii]KAI8818351.1 hypothetical protein EV422DRAFT_621882 [Fimicolochytrium jonesii]
MGPVPQVRRSSRSESYGERLEYLEDLAITPSRSNEFPPDPDTLLYGSFAPQSTLDAALGVEENGVGHENGKDDEAPIDIPPIIAEDVEDDGEGDDDDDDEEDLVRQQKSKVQMLKGKAAARLPQRAAAMASRTARADTPSRGQAAGNGYAILSGSEVNDGAAAHLCEQEYEVDEDVRIFIKGYRVSGYGRILYKVLCFFTAGILWLLCRWIPKWELAFTMRKCPLVEASHVAVTNQWNQMEVLPVACVDFDGSIADVFQQGPVSREGQATTLTNDVDLRASPLHQLISFHYRYMRFIYNPILGQFAQNSYWRDHRWTSVEKTLRGIDVPTASQRHQVFGDNAVVIAEKPVFRLLMDEVLNPFYVFQVASIILWCLDDYYYYAACIALISTTSAIATLIETRETMRRLRELSRFSCDVKVFRAGQWRVMKSDDIVPGDIYEVTPGMLPVFPCDGVLLQGDCIVNESMLTGESVPVSKTPIKDSELRTMDIWEEDPASSSRMSRFFVFAGTKIIRVRAGNNRSGTTTPNGSDQNLQRTATQAEPGALALAVRTGFNTTKGSLVRSMMFPKPNTFKFYRDSFRFIGVMGLIAGFGFLGSFYNFILLHVAPAMIIIRALDLITIVVPPALPATMAIGTSFAIGRLRKGDIYCTSPPRVNMCGKLDLIAFDKTGTLTEEGLDVLGFRFTVPNTTGGDAAVKVPLRFSTLYRAVVDVIPSGALHGRKVETSYDTFTRSRPDLLDRSMSGMSVALGVTSGHPNGSEPDFPYPLIVCVMATCHSIKVVNDELIGDPMDLKMFEFTGWNIDEGGNVEVLNSGRPLSAKQKGGVIVRPPDSVEFQRAEWDVNGTGSHKPTKKTYTELEVIKSFEFVSTLRRMSVIVRRLRYDEAPTATANGRSTAHSPTADKEFEVFVKGAPEIMRSICTPESLPGDYDQQLNDYAHHGYRVIACAWRRIDGLTNAKVLRMKRELVECELQFLGFIVFENKLKPGTAPVVNALRRARIREVMCTGDNVLTAISVSRECGLVDPSEKTFVPHFLPGIPPSSEDAKLVWEDVDGSGATLDPETLLPVLPPTRLTRPPSEPGQANNDSLVVPYNDVDDRSSNRSETDEFRVDINSVAAKVGEYNLAVTGDVFQWMLECGSDDSFNRMLVKGQIYARMSPDQKHFLVENFQELGYCVGFCGDGANDCGALKAADVGLSLSEAEASVAAPFTSRSTDLDCVLRVIREGRAALVTSFSCFKYMALYSLIQFTSVSLLYSLAGNLGDFQFLFIDLALIIPIAVFMGRSGAHPRIFRKRPTASLVSRKVLTSLICQVVIQAGFQLAMFMWIRRQPFYEKPKGDVDDRQYQSYENTTVFLLSCFQYIAVAVAFCVGPPYRASMWKNVPFLTTVITLFSFATFITLSPPAPIAKILDLIPIPFPARMTIFTVAMLDWALSWAGEHYIFPGIASLLKASSPVLWKLRRRSVPALSAGHAPPPAPPAGDLLALARVAKRDAKRMRWKDKGKVWKLVADDMRMEAANVVSGNGTAAAPAGVAAGFR